MISRGAPDELLCPRSGTMLRLQRAWPRGDDHLLCEYAAPCGGRIPAQWFADGERLREVASGTRGDIESVERDGVLLQRGGADRRLAPLRDLLEQPDATLVVHRPERRAVVRMRVDGAVVYAKVVRPGRATELVEHSTRVKDRAGGGFHTPVVRSVDDGRGVLILEELPGRSLFALRDGAAPEAWTAVGTALARWHDGDPTSLPRHRADDEADLTQRWLTHAATFGLLPPIDATDALGRLRDEPLGPVGMLHRDLHDKQLIQHTGRSMGILDTDTLAVGERALDIANLLVHLELRVRQGRLQDSSAAEARRRLLAAYRPDEQTRSRLDAYAIATRLRLAAVYSFRPRWRRIANDLLADAIGHCALPPHSADE